MVPGGYGCANGTVNPRTFTVGGSAAKDGETQATGGSADNWLAYKIYNSSPADVVIDQDDEGDNNALVSCYIVSGPSGLRP